jgi:hypothetical protein
MKYALISTIDVEQPYRFCEVSDVKFNVTEPALFWVKCTDDITPLTHKYTDEGFVELPKIERKPRPTSSTENSDNNTPTVL